MNTEQELKNLTAYPFENECLSLPESYMCYYLDEMVVCNTLLGYHYFQLEKEQQEHFHYGEFVDFTHLEECTHIPDGYTKRIKELDSWNRNPILSPLSLIAVSCDADMEVFTLYALEQDAYFLMPKNQLKSIVPGTLKKLHSCAFSEANLITISNK